MLLRKAPHNESMSDVPPQQSKSSGTEEHPVIALFLGPLVCTSGFFRALVEVKYSLPTARQWLRGCGGQRWQRRKSCRQFLLNGGCRDNPNDDFLNFP